MVGADTDTNKLIFRVLLPIYKAREPYNISQRLLFFIRNNQKVKILLIYRIATVYCQNENIHRALQCNFNSLLQKFGAIFQGP